MRKVNSNLRSESWVLAGVVLLFCTATLFAQAPPPSKDTKPSTTIPIVMTLEAGNAYWKPYPGAKRTMHVGLGQISPFGPATYSCGLGFPEQKEIHKPDYFNSTWQSTYHTGLFCVYTVPEGKIYTMDGIIGNLIPETKTEDKSDYLINVVLGGTGIFKGATGLWLGKTVGAGAMKDVAPKQPLPSVIIKSMSGYVKVPRVLEDFQPAEVRSENEMK